MLVETVTEMSPTLDTTIADHLRQTFGEDDMRRISEAFQREGYVKVSNIVPADVKSQVRQEAFELLDQFAIRRDTRIEQTGNTPRRMSNVHTPDIERSGAVIPAVYESRALRKFLGRLALGFFGRELSTGEWRMIEQEVVTCPYAKEKYIINQQTLAGDTHGWHWGDYTYTLIWVVEAPPIECGGLLQCIPHVTWNKNKPDIYQCMIEHPISSYYHASGDIYFLKSDTTLHRTVPMSEDARRVIVNTCWGSRADEYKLVDHGTMEQAFTDDGV